MWWTRYVFFTIFTTILRGVCFDHTFFTFQQADQMIDRQVSSSSSASVSALASASASPSASSSSSFSFSSSSSSSSLSSLSSGFGRADHQNQKPVEQNMSNSTLFGHVCGPGAPVNPSKPYNPYNPYNPHNPNKTLIKP